MRARFRKEVLWIAVILSYSSVNAVDEFPSVFDPNHKPIIRTLSKDEFSTHLADLLARSDNGDIDAMHDIAWLYDPSNPESPQKNKDKAMHWYTKAAEKGHILAGKKLAVSLLKKSDASSIQKAETYLRKGATAGDVASQRILAEHLLTLEDKNGREEGRTWLLKAAEAKDPTALLKYADFTRDGAFIHPTPAILRKAFDQTYHAAELHHLPAILRLSELYKKGIGTAKDEVAALQWLSLAAKQGDREAQTELAYHHWNAPENTRNYEAIRRWLLSAVTNDRPISRAAYLLGVLYENGLAVPFDETEANRWFDSTARNGHYQSQLRMMHLASQGIVGEFSYQQDLDQLQVNADSGDRLDQFLLGKFYETGFPKLKLEKNLTRAHHYYDLAAKQGLPAAITALEKLSLQIQSKK